MRTGDNASPMAAVAVIPRTLRRFIVLSLMGGAIGLRPKLMPAENFLDFTTRTCGYYSQNIGRRRWQADRKRMRWENHDSQRGWERWPAISWGEGTESK